MSPTALTEDVRPTAAADSGPQRLVYQASLTAVTGSYEASQRARVETVAEANVVASATRDGYHAPALDVDMPAVLTHAAAGLDLWVDAPMHLLGYRKLLAAATRVGVARTEPVPTWREATRTARRLRYDTARVACVDDSEWQRILVGLGPTMEAGFAAAVATAKALAAPAALTTGPRLRNPWRLPLAVPATVMPSTHNVHLYLDTKLSWESYHELLVALVKAKVVEPGYLGASTSRGATFLRLPWVRKPGDEQRAEY